jgi:hypothetical protein
VRLRAARQWGDGDANHDGIAGRLDEGESAMPIKKSF